MLTRDQVLRFIRRNRDGDPADCQIMGHRLRDFTPEEQAEILMWALENEQKRSADYLSGWRLSEEAWRIQRASPEAFAG